MIKAIGQGHNLRLIVSRVHWNRYLYRKFCSVLRGWAQTIDPLKYFKGFMAQTQPRLNKTTRASRRIAAWSADNNRRRAGVCRQCRRTAMRWTVPVNQWTIYEHWHAQQQQNNDTDYSDVRSAVRIDSIRFVLSNQSLIQSLRKQRLIFWH